MTSIGMICVVIITMGAIGAIVVALLGNALREQEREKQAKEPQQSHQEPVVSQAQQMKMVANREMVLEVDMIKAKGDAYRMYDICIVLIKKAAINGEKFCWIPLQTLKFPNDYAIGYLKILLKRDGFEAYTTKDDLVISW